MLGRESLYHFATYGCSADAFFPGEAPQAEDVAMLSKRFIFSLDEAVSSARTPNDNLGHIVTDLEELGAELLMFGPVPQDY